MFIKKNKEKKEDGRTIVDSAFFQIMEAVAAMLAMEIFLLVVQGFAGRVIWMMICFSAC